MVTTTAPRSAARAGPPPAGHRWSYHWRLVQPARSDSHLAQRNNHGESERLVTRHVVVVHIQLVGAEVMVKIL